MNRIVNSFLNRYKKELMEQFHLKEMWLWGSYVWGKPNDDSDLDIMLVSNDFKKYRFIKRSAEVINRLKIWEDKKIPDIDFICYTPEEFNKKKKQISLAKEVAQKGIKII